MDYYNPKTQLIATVRIRITNWATWLTSVASYNHANCETIWNGCPKLQLLHKNKFPVFNDKPLHCLFWKQIRKKSGVVSLLLKSLFASLNSASSVLSTLAEPCLASAYYGSERSAQCRLVFPIYHSSFEKSQIT